MKRILIIATLAACQIANAAEYLIAHKGTIPAWAPADVEAHDYRDWHSLTPELQSYNPPHYPTVILRHTRIMAIQPGSWTSAVAEIAAQQQAARESSLPEVFPYGIAVINGEGTHIELIPTGDSLPVLGMAISASPLDKDTRTAMRDERKAAHDLLMQEAKSTKGLTDKKKIALLMQAVFGVKEE